MGVCKMQSELQQVGWRALLWFLRYICIHWLWFCIKGEICRATVFNAQDKMGWHNPALSKWKRDPNGGAVGGAKRFLFISLSGGNRARRELSLSLAPSIHAGPCPLSSMLKNRSSESEILQNVKQKVLSRIEVSVATKIFNSCHWPGIINRFPFVFGALKHYLLWS